MCDFYLRSHGVIHEFRTCYCITFDNLHITYCMHLYGCDQWNFNDKKIEAFRIGWRKIKRQIWKFLARAHNIIVYNLNDNFDMCSDMRIIKFVYNAF